MNIRLNKAVIINRHGVISFGVVRKKVTIETPAGETISYQCDVFSAFFPGDAKPVEFATVSLAMMEEEVFPIDSFSQYGSSKTFFENLPGFIWAEKYESDLDAAKAARLVQILENPPAVAEPSETPREF